MLRRPPTSIELKLDDVIEYEVVRREQEANKEQNKKQPYNDPPAWQPGPKSKQEIISESQDTHERTDDVNDGESLTNATPTSTNPTTQDENSTQVSNNVAKLPNNDAACSNPPLKNLNVVTHEAPATIVQIPK
ncbi:hypothetical protein FQA39_LY01484 [Lamprigera yunnana]|nr:hypothetical protein FQA39_LY01484 [Lamprigera yunnana]